MAPVTQYDLAIVGTGPAGLTMAKTYLQVNPESSVILLEAGPSIGGVWSKERLYWSLKTNTTYGMFEFSDLPMVEDLTSLKGLHIPGSVVNNYLLAYAGKFDLNEHVTLQSKVEVAEMQSDSSWVLTIRDMTDTTKSWSLHTARLVVATGQTTEPVMPTFNGQGNFGVPLFHSKYMAAESPGLRNAKNVVVQGGSKSAYDAAYQFAEMGVQVHWVIRKSGFGPCYTAKSRVTPLKLIADRLLHTRIMSWLNPTIWGEADGYVGVRRLINQTSLGQKLIAGNTNAMQESAIEDAGIMAHPETAKLKPWHDIFWVGVSRGMLNYDHDIFEHVREGRIKVYIEDISHLSHGTVHLDDAAKTALPADALVCANGWQPKPSIQFLRDGMDISAELGLPHYTAKPSSEYLQRQQRADDEILTELPYLANQPVHRNPYLATQQSSKGGFSSVKNTKPPPPLLKPHDRITSPITNTNASTSLTDSISNTCSPPTSTHQTKPLNTPYLLHRLTVPPSQIHTRTIAFAGAFRSSSTSMLAQTQALWITAFFNHALPHLELGGTQSLFQNDSGTRSLNKDKSHVQEEVEKEAMLLSRYSALRYPLGYGSILPEMFFDVMPFNDLLLRDMGLRRWRKGNVVKQGPDPGPDPGLDPGPADSDSGPASAVPADSDPTDPQRGGGRRTSAYRQYTWSCSFWREWIEEYTPRDYIGLVEEWCDSQERIKNGGISFGQEEVRFWEMRKMVLLLFAAFGVMGLLMCMWIMVGCWW